jgi:hypothetical protein
VAELNITSAPVQFVPDAIPTNEPNQVSCCGVSAEQQSLGLEACYQSEALLHMLLVASHEETGELRYLLRGLVPRLLKLIDVSTSCHDRGGDSLADIRDRLHGGFSRLLTFQKGAA